MKKFILLKLVIVAAAASTFAQGTAFTYQGRLHNNGTAANGSYDLQFAIFDAAAGGNQIGSALTNNTVAVSNGLFMVTLDFGAGVYTGADRWLLLSVKTNGAVSFTTLTPPQQITATPYAITAGNLSGAVSSASLLGAYTNTVTISNAANVFAGSFVGTFTNATLSDAGIYNVKRYGAIGAGVGSSAADSAAIAAAITALTNARWGTLYFPPGHYYDTNVHHIRISPLESGLASSVYTIRGDGMAATEWKYFGPNTSGNFITFEQCWPHMHDLTVRGPGANVALSGARGTNYNGGTRASMERVAFKGWGDFGAQLEGVYGGKVDWCEFEDNFIGLGIPTYADGMIISANLYRNVVGIAQNSYENSFPLNATPGLNNSIYAVGNHNRYGIVVTMPCEISGYFEGNTNATVAIGWDTNYFTGRWANLWAEQVSQGAKQIKVHNLVEMGSFDPGVIQFYTSGYQCMIENVICNGAIYATQAVVRFNFNVETNTLLSVANVANSALGTTVTYSDGTTTTAANFSLRQRQAIGTSRTGTTGAMLQVVKNGAYAEALPNWTLTLSGSDAANSSKDTMVGMWGFENGNKATGSDTTPFTALYGWASGVGAHELRIGGGSTSGKNFSVGRLFAGDATSVGSGVNAFAWTANAVYSYLPHNFSANIVVNNATANTLVGFGAGKEIKSVALSGLTYDGTTLTATADVVAQAAIKGLNQKLEAVSQESEGRIWKLEAENTELKQRLEKLERLLGQNIEVEK